MTALLVLAAGLHTTVQDAGRVRFQHLGVPAGGALDRPALRAANRLVGNTDDEAALEVTLVGCRLRAEGDVHVAVTGATFALDVGGRSVPMRTPLSLRDGDVLTLGARAAGARSYVAVRGGIDTPVVLGSRSAWPLLPRRGALQDGQRLPVAARAVRPLAAQRQRAATAMKTTLRVLAAPDLDGHAAALETLMGGSYRVAASASRMAYPLEGAAVTLPAPHRSSSGTVTGALQILPSGQPVLLLHERQTTGGYPIAAVVATVDLAHAAQLAPGDEVRFAPCTRADALRALMQEAATWDDA